MSSKVIRDPAVPVQSLTWRPASGAPHGSPPLCESARTAPLEGSASAPVAAALEAAREAELKRKTEEAFRAGVHQGESTARQNAAAAVDEQIRALARTAAEIASLRQKIRHETERELVELSLAIARRILHRELTIDPEALAGLIKAAVQKIDLRETHRLRTHPDHMAAVTRHLAQIGAPVRIEVVADARLERGAAVFETSRGALDASADTQLAEIQHGFTDLLGAES